MWNVLAPPGTALVRHLAADLQRYILRQGHYNSIYPLNRFNRFEIGATFLNVDRATVYLSQGIDFGTGYSTGQFVDSIRGAGSLNFTFGTDEALAGKVRA